MHERTVCHGLVERHGCHAAILSSGRFICRRIRHKLIGIHALELAGGKPARLLELAAQSRCERASLHFPELIHGYSGRIKLEGRTH